MKRLVFFGLTLCLSVSFVLCSSDTQEGNPEIVQPAEWWSKLPRPAYADLRKIENTQWWFEVYKLPHDIYAIYEPNHFEEVISYLVIGRERGLLIDTGMGIGDLKRCVEELTDLPVSVVNTHTHFDHIGGNSLFDVSAIYNNVECVNKLLAGKTNEELQVNLRKESLRDGRLPEEFDRNRWVIPPVEPSYLLEDGSPIELGGRTLEVIHTPGHSPGSICLLDKESKILFTGDMFFPGPLYAYPADVNIDDYIDSFKKLNSRITEFDYLCPGHNEPWVNSEVIPRVIKGFDDIMNGRGKFTEAEGLRRYTFEGFEVLIRKDMIK